jgi:hypothetical protein
MGCRAERERNPMRLTRLLGGSWVVPGAKAVEPNDRVMGVQGGKGAEPNEAHRMALGFMGGARRKGSGTQ